MKKIVLAMILATMASSVMAQGYSQPGDIGDPEYRTVKPNLGHYPTEERYDPYGHRLDAREWCRRGDKAACVDYYRDRYGDRQGARYYNPYKGQNASDFIVGAVITEILRSK